jgi:hypothetical protein
MRSLVILLLVSACAHLLLAADLPFEDQFTEISHPLRKLSRGEWKVENGVATCTQSDALFKKSKNHGPIIRWDLPTTDSVIEFEYRADVAVQAMIFTVNRTKGHAFRVMAKPSGSRVIAYAANHDEPGISAPAPAMKPNEWQKIRVEIRGNKATALIAGETIEVIQPALAGPKATITIGFSYGTLAVRKVRVSP